MRGAKISKCPFDFFRQPDNFNWKGQATLAALSIQDGTTLCPTRIQGDVTGKWENCFYKFLCDGGVDINPSFLINTTERNYIIGKVGAFRKRAIRQQRFIVRDLIVARRTGNRALALECERELNKLARQFWNLGSLLKARVLVKRKGTERSRSRSGSQTICTHTSPVFDEGCKQRWLFGLAVETSRAANTQNRVKECAPHGARPEALRLKTQYFVIAKTNVEQHNFKTRIRAAATFRQRKKVDNNRSRSGLGFPSWDKSCYPSVGNGRLFLRRDDTVPSRVVRPSYLGNGNGHYRLLHSSIGTS